MGIKKKIVQEVIGGMPKTRKAAEDLNKEIARLKVNLKKFREKIRNSKKKKPVGSPKHLTTKIAEKSGMSKKGTKEFKKSVKTSKKLIKGTGAVAAGTGLYQSGKSSERRKQSVLGK
jgi:hypothetical protein